jgi:hypothetical protein
MNLFIPEEASIKLDDVAKKHEVSKSELIRRAMSLVIYISENTGKNYKLSITDMKDKVIKDIIIF